MFKRELFLGYPIDPHYEQELADLNPQLLAFFIKPRGDYLQRIIYLESHYLGRIISSPATLSDIEKMHPHIYSLLRRLIPDYPYERNPLWLFPLVEVTIVDPLTESEVSVGRN